MRKFALRFLVQVPWRRLKGCDVQPERRSVVLKLFAESAYFGTATRMIACSNDAATQVGKRGGGRGANAMRARACVCVSRGPEPAGV